MPLLCQHMIDDMSVRGLAENTRKSYLNAVTGRVRHFRRSPDRIEPREVQDYLLFLHEKRGLTWQSYNTVRRDLRFFYRITLSLPDPHLYVPGAKQPTKLPEILNHDELMRLFTVTTNPKHRALLMTAYAAGLRASELERLSPPALQTMNVSVYALGGVRWLDGTFTNRFHGCLSSTPCSPAPDTPGFSSGTEERNVDLDGWMIGLGAERTMRNQLALRLESRYTLYKAKRWVVPFDDVGVLVPSELDAEQWSVTLSWAWYL